jgi:glycerol-3-phosphate acyltransferase PlsY
MLKLVALLAFGYLLGSVPFGWVVMKVWHNQDVRTLGSGNIGAANVYRAGGPGAFAATLIADGLKGAIPVLVAILLARPGDPDFTPTLVGLAAVVGHSWPVFLRFRGGKGVATTGGVMLVLAPVAVVLSLVAWFTLIRLTKLASLSSLVAVGVGFLTLLGLHFGGWQAWRPVDWPVIILGAALLGLVVYRHRGNIERLASGREIKLTAH